MMSDICLNGLNKLVIGIKGRRYAATLDAISKRATTRVPLCGFMVSVLRVFYLLDSAMRPK